MNCHEFRSRIARYLDGELSPGTLREIEEHVTRCEGCRGEVEELRALRREWTGVPAPVADPAAREAILRAARALPADRRRAARSWIPRLHWSDLVTASALAASLLLAWTYLRVGSTPRQERRSWGVLSIEEVRAREAGRTIESGEPLTIQWSNRSADD